MQVSIEEIQGMMDSVLLERSVQYNRELRRGRKLVAEGEALIKDNINNFVMCQNEFMSRISAKIEHETNKLEK